MWSSIGPKAQLDEWTQFALFAPPIRDEVNEKQRPPCGGLSKAVRDVRYAALDFWMAFAALRITSSTACGWESIGT
jgi:hypothetical protein